MAEVDPLSLTGKTLAGHFLVEGVKGEGRFSIVYRGEHLGPKEPVALKCFKLGLALETSSAETFLKRFREESKTSSRLSKTNRSFVRSIGSGMTTSDAGQHVPYTVLEWLDGKSFATELAARRKNGASGRALVEALDLLGPAIAAIGEAHTAGIAHGDICAGTFFLTDAGDVKVLDLGVAKLVRDLSREIAPDVTHPRVFSPQYGAPEHFDAHFGDVGPRTDVYGIALLLLEALRDRPAIESSGGPARALANAALDPTKRPTPRALGVRVGNEVEKVMARAVALVASERFANATELLEALKTAVKKDASSPLARNSKIDEFSLADDDDVVVRPSTERASDKGVVAQSRSASAEDPIGSRAASKPASAVGVGVGVTAGGVVGVTAGAGGGAGVPLTPRLPPRASAPPLAPMPPAPPAPLAAAAPGGPSTSIASVAPPAGPSATASAFRGTTKMVPPSPSPKRDPSTAPPPKSNPAVSALATSSPNKTPLFRHDSPTSVDRHASPRHLAAAAPVPAAPVPGASLPPPPLAPVAPSPAHAPASPPHASHSHPSHPPAAHAPPPRASAPAAPSSHAPPARLPSTSPAAPVVGIGDMKKMVRDVVPPPPSNIVVGDLPSVIVDDPDVVKGDAQRWQDQALRSRDTMRLESRPGAPAWAAHQAQAPQPGSVPGMRAASTVSSPTGPGALPIIALQNGSEGTRQARPSLTYETRRARSRSRLLVVAFASFLCVFLIGAALLFAHWYMGRKESAATQAPSTTSP